MASSPPAIWCRFGNTVLVHFEDMAHANLDRLLSQYRGSMACFSDDVQVCSRALLVTLGIVLATQWNAFARDYYS